MVIQGTAGFFFLYYFIYLAPDDAVWVKRCFLCPLFFSSMQVEVTVSLVPPVADSRAHKIVLILSSSVPVNWAITAHSVQGRISVHVRASAVIYITIVVGFVLFF